MAIPTCDMLGQDELPYYGARILEKFQQVLDAGISTRQSATGDCVLRRFIPVVGDLPKIQIGIITDSKRADFGFEITEPTFR